MLILRYQVLEYLPVNAFGEIIVPGTVPLSSGGDGPLFGREYYLSDRETRAFLSHKYESTLSTGVRTPEWGKISNHLR